MRRLKKTCKLIVTLALLTGGPTAYANSSAAAVKISTMTAFQISKEKNGNLVRYDVQLNPDCTFADDALSIYWLIQGKGGGYEKKSMNFIENGYYGLRVSKKGPHEIEGQVKSLKNRDIDIQLRILVGPNPRGGPLCVVQTLGHGDQLHDTVRVSSIRLEDFHGEIPHRLSVLGKKENTKEPVRYQISLK